MKYFISEKFRVFEQFTRFLRPGCELIDCGDANSVAGYDPSAMALAIVTVNDGGRDFKETFDLSKFAGTGETAQCFRTSDHEGFKELPPLKIEKQSFSAVIPADSVTTFVLQGVRKL